MTVRFRWSRLNQWALSQGGGDFPFVGMDSLFVAEISSG
jgi:hypothetical protein